MTEETRVIDDQAELLRERKRIYAVHREGGFYILYNTLTRSKHFYARIQDVQNFLARPAEPNQE